MCAKHTYQILSKLVNIPGPHLLVSFTQLERISHYEPQDYHVLKSVDSLLSLTPNITPGTLWQIQSTWLRCTKLYLKSRIVILLISGEFVRDVPNFRSDLYTSLTVFCWHVFHLITGTVLRKLSEIKWQSNHYIHYSGLWSAQSGWHHAEYDVR